MHVLRLSVLFEDNHLLVVNKQACLPTQGAAEGEESLCEIAKSYLKEKYKKPGNVFLGIVSRLDSFVSGAIVLARTSKAAARLNEQFSQGEVEKTYRAILERPPMPPVGTCEDRIVKDDEAHRMRVAADSRDGQFAKLSYETLQMTDVGVLVEVHLETGRKHQIRVQFSSRGWPIVGDRKYGARSTFPQGIALHSRQLKFRHPVSREFLTFDAPIPDYWPS